MNVPSHAPIIPRSAVRSQPRGPSGKFSFPGSKNRASTPTMSPTINCQMIPIHLSFTYLDFTQKPYIFFYSQFAQTTIPMNHSHSSFLHLEYAENATDRLRLAVDLMPLDHSV